MIVLFAKTITPYLKAVILSLKIYENKLKFYFLIPPIKYIDCVHSFKKQSFTDVRNDDIYGNL